MSNSCKKLFWIIYLLSTREKNDAPSLHCFAVFSAHDFAISDFPTPAGPHIYSK